MCGFVVCVDKAVMPEGSPIGLSSALDAIHHRGPDDCSEAHAGPCTFGFQRLAIIDTDGSRQPLRYPVSGPQAGRWTVVCNGEIYNYRGLRAELIEDYGCEFATEGDIEVLAAALHVWGIDALRRLRGMFAFAAWDDVEGVLHAGRDPFGIKPLYVAALEDRLWLASEKKTLMSIVDRYAVDSTALSHYLTLQYVPEPHSLHRDVARLAAGERLEYRPGGDVKIESWSRPIFRPQPVTAGTALHQTLVSDIRETLRESVRAHMVADVPVGAFLSSGIDSTAIVALAREVKPDLRVYTAGFEETETAGYSELGIAADTAQQLGLRHTAAVVRPEDVIATLPRIIWHLDDPLADPALIPLYFVAKAAAQDVTVVLSGEGADELFGGYAIYREPASVAPVQKLPRAARLGLRALGRLIPEGVKGHSFLDRATTPIEERYYGNARMFDDRSKGQLLRAGMTPYTQVTEAAYAEAAALDDVATMQYVDLRTWLPGDILTKADRMSMAHSLELRVPFLDKRVFDVAARIPAELKVPRAHRTTKVALREAMRGIVPDSVVDRPKLGFPTPTRVWLKGVVGEWAAEVMFRSSASELLDLGYAQKLLADHRAGVADYSRKVWTVLSFCLWYAIFVERSIDAAAPVGVPRQRQAAPVQPLQGGGMASRVVAA
ncbi:putative asparagine synthetase AsnB [Virgisporangium aliadipatigenens]|uniref:asparagine synthase (glutamine-hydrolyzing) n=1 Tax=Virgisporangium aliadipatigenens TaxID=741659 RepID=A0A8J3YHP5_9ACTN|nr:asparagine synthase (glutamine-hydrolyzing) [Virgisporangium aliadipatigenens]GIJ44482.1 putative asparagine synthetase AsnB [Virgisporangium aliadipatigenens]